MKTVQQILDGLKKGPRDIVGVDVGSTGVRAVRMRASGDTTAIVAAALLPPPEMRQASDGSMEVSALQLPARLRTKHAAIALTGQNAVIKLLSFPGHFEAHGENKVIENLGLDDPDKYRISYKLLTEGHGRSESRVLAVAWGETEARLGAQLFPSGQPAPYSLEISGLASTAAFLSRPGEHLTSAVGLLDIGSSTSTYSLFNRGMLTLVRRFGFGSASLVGRVKESLGVDEETALGIISDGSFDISQSVTEVMEPFIKQLIVSRDFVERRENCHVTHMYVSGGISKSHDAMGEIKNAMEVEVVEWSPLDGLTVMKDAIPPELAGREWQLSAAIGACIGTFEET